ncbi:MAG: PxKF domain-containing protein [Nitrososphaera sp.]
MQNRSNKWLNKNALSVNAMAAIAIGAMLIFSVSGLKAFADNIQDDIVVTPPQKTITIPGFNDDGSFKDASTTVNYWVDANSAGGKDFAGCDASDGSSVTVSFSVPSGVAKSPNSLTFSQCGTSTTNTKSVTYTSNKPGDYDISVSATDTAGRYNTEPASFTLHVLPPTTPPPPPPDTTNPTIAITSPEDGATLTSDSVTVKGTASDSGSGLQKVEVKVDGGSYSTATGTGTWSFDVSNLAEGPHTITAQATDKAGNTATASIKVTYTPPDTTAPTLQLPSTELVAEATSADGAVVTYTVTATDDRDPSPTVTCTPASGSTFPLGTTPVNCKATDAAGNKAEGSFNVIVKDTIKPVIQVTSSISDGQQFYFGNVPSAPTCTATDSGSGVNSDGCKVSGYATTVGPQTLTFTATDIAGNTATQTIKYTVLPWELKGFYQPVDMDTTTLKAINTVKAGSTVAVKFEDFMGSTEITSTIVNNNPVGAFSAKKVSCTGGTEDPIEQTVTATGGTALRYDTTSGQFVYNWQTPKTGVGACYDVTFTDQSGSALTAHFKLK